MRSSARSGRTQWHATATRWRRVRFGANFKRSDRVRAAGERVRGRRDAGSAPGGARAGRARRPGEAKVHEHQREA